MAKKLNVKGVAVRSGVSRNGYKYVPQELAPYAPTLKSRPIMKDHLGTVDSTVGLVTNSYSNDDGESVVFEGWIKEDSSGTLEKIEDERIKEVSIGAIASRIVKESEDSEELIPRGLTAVELSLTPIPGVIGTSISQAITENLNDFKKIQEGKKMEIKEMEHCPECDKEFKTKAELKKHMEEEEMEEENFKTRLTERMKETEKTLTEVKELRLSLLKEKYSLVCEKKGVKAQDVNVGEEELKALIKVTESLVIPQPSTPYKSQVPEQPDVNKVGELYDGIVFERAEFGKGVAFYREEFDNPKLIPQRNMKYKTTIKNV